MQIILKYIINHFTNFYLIRTKKWFVAVCLFGASILVNAQPEIAWQRCYGGSDNDFFRNSIETIDTGIIAIISSGSEDGDLEGIPNSGGWVIKFDKYLNLEWQKFYSTDSFSYGLVQPISLADGKYAFGGEGGVGCNKNHGGSDLFVMNSESNGDTIWSRCYGSPGNEVYKSILNTQDNGYLITGSSYSSGGDIPFHYGDMSTDAIICKIDSIGNIQWLKVLGGSSYDDPMANPVEVKRGYYQIHIGSSSDDYDLADCPVTDLKKRWIIELDSNGAITKQNFISAEDDLLTFSGVLLGDESQTIIIGTGNANSAIFPAPVGHLKDEGAIAVFDSSLALIEMKQYGGSGTDRFQRCERDTEGNYYLFGYSDSDDFDLPDNFNEGDNYDYWICKVSSDFQLIWSKNFGGSEYDGDLGGGVLMGNIILKEPQLYVFTGAVMPVSLPDHDIECGHLEEEPNFYNFMDAWLVDFDLTTSISEIPSDNSFSIYPNPSSETLFIESDNLVPGTKILNMYDVRGIKVRSEELSDDNKLTKIDIKEIHTGIYFLQIIGDGVVLLAQKLIIE